MKREYKDKKVRKLATAKSRNTIRAKAFGRKIDRMLEEKYGTCKKENKGAEESVDGTRIHIDGEKE